MRRVRARSVRVRPLRLCAPPWRCLCAHAPLMAAVGSHPQPGPSPPDASSMDGEGATVGRGPCLARVAMSRPRSEVGQPAEGAMVRNGHEVAHSVLGQHAQMNPSAKHRALATTPQQWASLSRQAPLDRPDPETCRRLIEHRVALVWSGTISMSMAVDGGSGMQRHNVYAHGNPWGLASWRGFSQVCRNKRCRGRG